MAANSLDLFANDVGGESTLDLFAPKKSTSAITGKEIELPRLTDQEVVNAMEFVNRREKGIDYFSGVSDAGFRAGFSKADNEKERKAFFK